VADEAVDDFEAFHAGTALVDEHMADQLLVLLALASGRIRVPPTTCARIWTRSPRSEATSKARRQTGHTVRASAHSAVR